MLTLPAEHCALIAALSVCLTGAQAGLLMPDRHEDPDELAAALETASRRTGVPIRQAWLDHDRMTLAWLRADDMRLVAEPELAILGVMI
jgi:hypothetical protein